MLLVSRRGEGQEGKESTLFNMSQLSLVLIINKVTLNIAQLR